MDAFSAIITLYYYYSPHFCVFIHVNLFNNPVLIEDFIHLVFKLFDVDKGGFILGIFKKKFPRHGLCASCSKIFLLHMESVPSLGLSLIREDVVSTPPRQRGVCLDHMCIDSINSGLLILNYVADRKDTANQI